jgi:hypothetical protein
MKVELWAKQNYPKIQTEIASSMALLIVSTLTCFQCEEMIQ